MKGSATVQALFDLLNAPVGVVLILASQDNQPQHCFRKSFVSELKRSRADSDAVEFLAHRPIKVPKDGKLAKNQTTVETSRYNYTR
jgi:hypothetical protein